MAFDIMPSAGAIPHPANGFAWFDACDANLQDAYGNVAVGCARLIIKPDCVEVGHIAYDGAPMKPVYIISNGQRVAKFTPTGVEFFVPVKAPSFTQT